VGHDFAYPRAEVGVGLVDAVDDGFEQVALGGEEVVLQVDRVDFPGDEADDFVGELDLGEGALAGGDFVEGEADELAEVAGEVAGGFGGVDGLLLDVEVVGRQGSEALLEQLGDEVLVEAGGQVGVGGGGVGGGCPGLGLLRDGGGGCPGLGLLRCTWPGSARFASSLQFPRSTLVARAVPNRYGSASDPSNRKIPAFQKIWGFSEDRGPCRGLAQVVIQSNRCSLDFVREVYPITFAV
jgi:hypothetical protein